MMLALKIVGAAIAIASAMANAEKEPPVKLVDSQSGLDTLVEEASIELFRGSKPWEEMWLRHKGRGNQLSTQAANLYVEPVPQLDFKKQMVLAVFTGQSQGSISRYRVVDINSGGNRVIVRLKPEAFVEGPVSPSINVGGRGFTFFLMSRTSKEVIVEVPDGQNWRPVGQFPELKVVKSTVTKG